MKTFLSYKAHANVDIWSFFFKFHGQLISYVPSYFVQFYNQKLWSADFSNILTIYYIAM